MFRLLLFLGAVGIFYAIVNSEARTLTLVSDVFVITAAAVGIYMVSQHDWSVSGARFEAVGRLGLILNQVVPDFGRTLPHWNVVRNGTAAVLAIALPIGLLRSAEGFKWNWKGAGASSNQALATPSISKVRTAVLLLAGLVIAFSLLLTESRMPWFAYLAIAGLALMWWAAGAIAPRLNRRRVHVFLIVLGVAALLGILAIPGSLQAFDSLPGPDNIASRAEIFGQAWKLAQDTPFTGGGLGQFAALYSTYIQVIPHALFLTEDTGNNAYLNVLVEQGWLGLVSLIAVLGIAAYWALVRLSDDGERGNALAIAGAIGLAFVVLYGLFHAMLVGTRAIPFLLIPAGLVLGAKSRVVKPSPQASRILTLGLLALFVLVVAALVDRRPLIASWQANLGAIQMANAQLAGWPTNQWDDGSEVAKLAPAKRLFTSALKLDPGDRTTHHRLGLVAMIERDFATAVTHLEQAFLQDPDHRGIRKSFGYSYVWSGEADRAQELLEAIPEAEDEMGVYAWWWGEQGRDDLARSALFMSEKLAAR